MNNQFLNSLTRNTARTENNMATHTTSLSALVDYFGIAGAARNLDASTIEGYFSKAVHQNAEHALKLLFWTRDVRGGAGERKVFRNLTKYLAENYPDYLKGNVRYIAEYGRWDDLLELFNTPLEHEALRAIADGLREGNALCAKWMPRKGADANKLRAYLQLTPKEYRKTLVKLTNAVEQLMCANEFEAIDYSKLPSVASARYQKAFGRHDPIGYSAYIESLKKGEVKINAGAVYPYDVVKSLYHGNKDVANAQWLALPDYMEGSENHNILPVVDVSGSMGCAAGKSNNVSCMDVSVSLGMYLAERNRGAFKDHFITFSGTPELQKLTGSLYDRNNQLRRADWGMNTNIEATFDLILNQAKRYHVPVEDMPTQILILSDMQFDECTGSNRYRGYGNDHNCPEFNPNALTMIKHKYLLAGYKAPSIVFWCLRGAPGQSPVQVTDTGTALVSGFSPAIMKAILSASEIDNTEFTPEAVMMEVINSPRYERISV